MPILPLFVSLSFTIFAFKLESLFRKKIIYKNKTKQQANKKNHPIYKEKVCVGRIGFTVRLIGMNHKRNRFSIKDIEQI
jgi:hypothetical protein